MFRNMIGKREWQRQEKRILKISKEERERRRESMKMIQEEKKKTKHIRTPIERSSKLN